jgi:hypothetical protein
MLDKKCCAVNRCMLDNRRCGRTRHMPSDRCCGVQTCVNKEILSCVVAVCGATFGQVMAQEPGAQENCDITLPS